MWQVVHSFDYLPGESLIPRLIFERVYLSLAALYMAKHGRFKTRGVRVIRAYHADETNLSSIKSEYKMMKEPVSDSNADETPADLASRLRQEKKLGKKLLVAKAQRLIGALQLMAQM